MARTHLERMIGRLDRMLRREEGFTLVELLVVIQILGVLILITTVAFIGARDRAEDSTAQQAVARALATGRIVFIDNATYLDATDSVLEDAESSLDFVPAATPSTTPREVSSDAPSDEIFVAASYSDTRTCFFIRDIISAGIGYGTLADVDSTDCSASNAGSVTWERAWSV